MGNGENLNLNDYLAPQDETNKQQLERLKILPRMKEMEVIQAFICSQCIDWVDSLKSCWKIFCPNNFDIWLEQPKTFTDDKLMEMYERWKQKSI